MTQRMTTELANTLATVIADTFSDGLLEIYSGTPGATPDDASGGVLLCAVLLPAVAFATASAASVAMAGQWFGTVDVTGTAAWGRFSNRAEDRYLVITVGTSGTELILDTLSLTEGGVLSIVSFSYTIPTTT